MENNVLLGATESASYDGSGVYVHTLAKLRQLLAHYLSL